MSKDICSLMTKMPKNASKIGVTKEDVKEIVRDQVKSELNSTNASVEELN